MAPPTGGGFEGQEAELEADEEETGSGEAPEAVCETPEEKPRPRVKTGPGRHGGVAVCALALLGDLQSLLMLKLTDMNGVGGFAFT